MFPSTKVTTLLEALDLCKKYQCRIEFRNAYYSKPEYVIIHYGIQFDVAGRDLIEAANRVIDLFHVPPCDRETLPWWEDSEDLMFN